MEATARSFVAIGRRCGTLPPFTEKQIFHQSGSSQKQHTDDQQADQAHAPHHPAVHHVIHHLDLHFSDALQLRAGSIDDLLRPSQRPRLLSLIVTTHFVGAWWKFQRIDEDIMTAILSHRRDRG